MPSFIFCTFSCIFEQGLRSITQTVGCFVSLYIMSPKLTGLTVVVLPCLVGAGALIGTFLRRLSRLAQEQVNSEKVLLPQGVVVLIEGVICLWNFAISPLGVNEY